MRPIRTLLYTALALSISTPLMAKAPSEEDRLRAEAEHACYNDAQALRSDVVPDEAKACMTEGRQQLSPACGKVFDRGVKS